MGGCFNDLMDHSKDSFRWEPWRLSERYDAAIFIAGGDSGELVASRRPVPVFTLRFPTPRRFTLSVAHFLDCNSSAVFARALMHVLKTTSEDIYPFFFTSSTQDLPHRRTEKELFDIFFSLPLPEVVSVLHLHLHHRLTLWNRRTWANAWIDSSVTPGYCTCAEYTIAFLPH